MRRCTVAIALVTAALALAACTGQDSGTRADNDKASSSPSVSAPASAKSPAPAALADVTIVRSGFEDHPTWGPHAYVVHYDITNHGAKAADYYVGLEFIDKDGDVLGTTGITADQLGAGKTSTGDIAPLDVEIRNGKIADIQKVRVSQVDRT